jgi:hypothetical protein
MCFQLRKDIELECFKNLAWEFRLDLLANRQFALAPLSFRGASQDFSSP